MKINWGTAIVISFVCFISFIMYFVINMSTNKKYDHDLVVEDYYQQELKYQEDINKEENAKDLASNVSWQKTNEGIIISFPKDLESNNIKGKVFLYRPSNKQLDIEISISLSNHNLLIPDNSLLDGRWNIKVDWTYKNQDYMYKTDIIY
ncbi:FixH family protein [uncultured Winogradskyella sp.]|uniref:FixH family protein n=1 Tax=uncultured Winogradskyella sp. TaxID=395353 RepID=UPI0030D7D727|tara:strand:+ start:748 stop:1194 length:447 start_codon:yes stop_codon:yes gene_type:complete